MVAVSISSLASSRTCCVICGMSRISASRITASERALEHSRKMHPLGRIGTPDDVASAIDWLLSDDSDWITGQLIGIDGGLGTTRAGAS